MLEAPQHLLEERRRKGLDVRDEVWEGVLHVVPPPTAKHQLLGSDLLFVLTQLARSKNLGAAYEMGLFRPRAGESDYRVPDLVVAPRERMKGKGIEGPADLVVEILSDNDETFQKLPFYADLGVREVLVLHPETCEVRLFALSDGRMNEIAAAANGQLHARTLDVRLSRIDGPKLCLDWPGGHAEI